MAELAGDSSAVLAGARMIERAQRSVVQVRSGGRGIGAGVIWDPDGLVMTNHHVVAGGRRNVTVALHDGRTFDAGVVNSSGSLDLALLRLSGEATDLPAAPIGDSDALRVGELVYAIPGAASEPLAPASSAGWASFADGAAVPPRATCARMSRSRRETRVGLC